MKTCTAALVATLLTGTAHAATFIKFTSPEGVTTVGLSGDINYGDDQLFMAEIVGQQNVTVMLSSDGGNVDAALKISRTIRARNFDTYVSSGATCASACGLIWLSGRTRLISLQAHVGFHAPSRDGVATTGGSAVVGSYLGSLGLSDATVNYMVNAAPSDMAWLTPADAKRYGIAAKVYEGQPGEQVQQAAAAEIPSSGSTALPVMAAPTPGLTVTAEAPDPAPVDPVYAALSADRQKLVNQVSANFVATFNAKSLSGVNRAIAACYARATQVKTVRVLEYCFALDSTALSLVTAAGVNSPYNSKAAVDGRIDDLWRVVTFPQEKMPELKAVLAATINSVAKELAK